MSTRSPDRSPIIWVRLNGVERIKGLLLDSAGGECDEQGILGAVIVPGDG
jgi:hypothetical protein